MDIGLFNWMQISCLLTQLLFFGIEIIQFKEVGREYFFDFWNIFDFSQFIFYCLLIGLINFDSKLDDTGIHQFLVVTLQLLLIFAGFIKI